MKEDKVTDLRGGNRRSWEAEKKGEKRCKHSSYDYNSQKKTQLKKSALPQFYRITQPRVQLAWFFMEGGQGPLHAWQTCKWRVSVPRSLTVLGGREFRLPTLPIVL